MLPDIQTPTIAPDTGPRISDETAAHLAGLAPEQKSAMRASFAKSFPDAEIVRVFGATPAPTPIVTQGNSPNLSAEQKAQGYATAFKHATDKATVIEAARRDGINLGPDGKVLEIPVAKESHTAPKPAAPDYRLQWRERPDLPIEKLTALDAQYRGAFGQVELTQTEANAAFDAIQNTMAVVPKSEDARAAYFRREGEALEATYGTNGAEELVRLHSDWFKRLSPEMQQHLTETYALHSMAGIVTTANLQRAWLARRGRKA